MTDFHHLPMCFNMTGSLHFLSLSKRVWPVCLPNLCVQMDLNTMNLLCFAWRITFNWKRKRHYPGLLLHLVLQTVDHMSIARVTQVQSHYCGVPYTCLSCVLLHNLDQVTATSPFNLLPGLTHKLVVQFKTYTPCAQLCGCYQEPAIATAYVYRQLL